MSVFVEYSVMTIFIIKNIYENGFKVPNCMNKVEGIIVWKDLHIKNKK